MTFPLVIFLYAYFVFLFIWAILSLIGFYHLLRFGGRMFGSFFVGLLYIVGTLVILYVSYFYFSTIDWQAQATIFQGFGAVKNVFDSPTIFN
ncbi:MAG: hypothetical protein NTY12_00970 [Candidatus Falkowbacteria bacterium]|nr:hypothetical protein [Candidatus Falkowbacteria bacterium]